MTDERGDSTAVSLDGLDHVALVVADVAISARWYEEVLGLVDAFPGRWGGVPRMLLSPRDDGSLGTGVALFPRKSGQRAAEADAPFSHFAFRVDPSQLEPWRQRLAKHGVEYAEQDHEVSVSIYFRDPDGIRLEITAYFTGSGQSVQGGGG